MNFIVTGGAGFIGSHIVDNLIDNGHNVTILDNLSTGDVKNINSKAKFVQIDLSSEKTDEIVPHFADIDMVFHCAALPNVQYSMEYPVHCNTANVNSIINVLEAMRINNVKKIIYSGSCSVYGNATNTPTNESQPIMPLSPYALQKYICEEYCYLYNKIYNIEYIILRYFNVYGERMSKDGAYVSVISRFIQSLEQNKPLNIVNDGSQKRDFVYVKDVVSANIASAFSEFSNYIFNVGSGHNLSVNEIADCFNWNKQYGELRIEPKETLADINLIKDILKWYPKQDLKEWVATFLYKRVYS
jgi:UDP-glucose 4-epimerase